MYRRRGFRGNPIGLILVILFLFFAVGPFMLSMLEAFLPLLVLILIVAVAAMVMFGADKQIPVQRMINNIFGFTGQQFGSEQRFGAGQRVSQPDPEAIKRRNVTNKAIRRAGYQPGDNPDIELADIGLLVYEGSTEPKICRLSDVPTNATQIRPFVVLDLPTLPDTGGNGVIRFNLVDGSGKLRYTSRSRYTVKRGQNFITPKTWLPLTNQEVDGDWSLQVCVGDSAPFAIHEFEWLQIGGEVRAQFTGNGEIDELMQPAISQSAIEDPISLDELLADQGEAAPLVANARH